MKFLIQSLDRRLTILILALLVTAASPASAQQDAQQQLQSNRAKWAKQGRRNYQFIFNWNCYCHPDYTEPVTIVVRNGAIKSVTAQSGRRITGERLKDYFTIDGLFAFLGDALKRQPHSITVNYHPRLGYPVSGAIDYDARIADEEKGFKIAKLVLE